MNQGEYNNPLVGAYLYPRGNEWADAELYEVYDPARKSMFKIDSGWCRYDDAEPLLDQLP